MTASSRILPLLALLASLLAPLPLGAQAGGQDADPAGLLTVDHYVGVRSLVPSMEGQVAQLYLRQRVRADVAAGQAPSAGVVLFVHGAGTPAEVSFDVPLAGYSWMAHLAAAGFDVFSVEMTGYGRSTRPFPMNDACNLPAARQALLVPAVLPETCTGSYPHALTTIASDWNDIGAAVDHLRRVRGVERVSLVGWSLGGPRVGGYAAANPDKVEKLVLLAPSYGRASSATPPATLPASGTPMNVQTFDEFMANWERQAPCTGQMDPAVGRAIWGAMLATDPVGATWGPGVRRAPSTTTWGWNAEAAARVRAPTLLVAGVHDAQVAPARVRELHEDLGSADKVFVDLGCAAHGAMWEGNRTLLYDASLEWLRSGTVGGLRQGVVRLGY